MPEESNPEIEKVSPKLLRRDFLKGVGLLGLFLAISATKKGRQKLVVREAAEVFQNQELIDSVISRAAEISDSITLIDKRVEGSPAIERNPNYKSVRYILGEGIELYEQETGHKAIYRKNEGYRDRSYYIDRAIQISEEEIENRTTGTLLKVIPILQRRFPEEVFPEDSFALYTRKNADMHGFAACYIPDSGFADRVSNEDEYEDYRERVDSAVKSYIIRVKTFVEAAVEQNGGESVSASRILSFLLKENNGDLAKSIRDLSIFLKFMSRNNLETGEHVVNNPEIEDKVVGWVSENILDEYGEVGSYHRLTRQQYPYVGRAASILGRQRDQDLSLINQEGKPSHVWDMVDSLSNFPPVVIQVGVVHRQLETLEAQGLVKTSTDLHVLAELTEIDGYLTTFGP